MPVGSLRTKGELLQTQRNLKLFTHCSQITPEPVTNSGAAGTVEVELDDSLDLGVGTRITFEVVTDGQILRIDPDASARIQPGGNADGDYVQSSSVGARIELEKRSDTLWVVVNEINDAHAEWTRQS